MRTSRRLSRLAVLSVAGVALVGSVVGAILAWPPRIQDVAVGFFLFAFFGIVLLGIAEIVRRRWRALEAAVLRHRAHLLVTECVAAVAIGLYAVGLGIVASMSAAANYGYNGELDNLGWGLTLIGLLSLIGCVGIWSYFRSSGTECPRSRSVWAAVGAAVGGWLAGGLMTGLVNVVCRRLLREEWNAALAWLVLMLYPPLLIWSGAKIHKLLLRKTRQRGSSGGHGYARPTADEHSLLP